MSKQILDRAYAAEADYLSLLEGLVTLETPSNDQASLQRLADHLAELATERGFTVKRHPREGVGDIIEARLQGTAGGPRTLILCHYDTVWPLGTLESMPWKREGDKQYGPGSLDMKGGIANAFTAVAIANELGLSLAGDVTLLLTSDEETGSHHSRGMIEEFGREADRVLVLEAARDDGALKVGRKGVGMFTLKLTGRSSHAGNNPSDGASALRELAHLLIYTEDLADDEAGTTINVTTATAGFATNVIAETAVATVDMRVLKDGEAERVTEALHSYTPRDERVTLEVEGGLNRPPMEPNERNVALYEKASGLLADMGLALESSVVGGGSDGNFTSALGVATLDGLGTAGMGPHARFEHIRVRETLERVALVTALITTA